jgi:hypothetical protein
MTMAGHQENRLGDYVQGVQLSEIDRAKDAWEEGARKLREVHRRLLDAMPKVEEGVLKTKTGRTAHRAMRKVADRAEQRAAEMQRAADALHGVRSTLKDAHGDYEHMRQNPIVLPPKAHVPDQPTPEDIRNAHSTDTRNKQHYEGQVSDREGKARAVADGVDAEMRHASQVFAQIHGETPPDAVDFSGTGTSSQAGYFQPVGTTGTTGTTAVPPTPTFHGHVVDVGHHPPPTHVTVHVPGENEHTSTPPPDVAHIPVHHVTPGPEHTVTTATPSTATHAPVTGPTFNPQELASVDGDGPSPDLGGLSSPSSGLGPGIGAFGQVSGGVAGGVAGMAALKGLAGRLGASSVIPARGITGTVAPGSVGPAGTRGAGARPGGTGAGGARGAAPGAGGRGGARSGGAAGAGGRGGKKSKKGSTGFDYDEDAEQWLDDEGTGPGVLD